MNSPRITTVEDLIDRRPGFDAMRPAWQSEAVSINDFIAMSQGTSNAYSVNTGAGRVIINTGMGFEALTHKRLFDAIHPVPTRYIMLTQGHVDHVGGVAHFREPETEVIAQANLAQCQRDDARIKPLRQAQSSIWFSHVFAEALRIGTENPAALLQDTPTADILFQQHRALTLGSVDFELISTPGGETVDSCVVWLPRERILFSGNVLGPLFPHFPNINTLRGDKYRYLEPYIAGVELLRGLRPRLLITGHFDPIEGEALIDAALGRLCDAASYVHRETLAGMNAGKDVYTLMREVKLPDALRVGQGYGRVSWAVRTIWESYMGWFTGRRTSELYATEPATIHAELVSLAGVDAVVKRARAALARGDSERANLFAEAALEAAPDDPLALTLAIDCQRELRLRRTEPNFWEDGWLDHRTSALEARLQALQHAGETQQ